MFKLSIETSNAAFEDNASEEVARILEAAADKLRIGHGSGALLDINGNAVGSWELS